MTLAQLYQAEGHAAKARAQLRDLVTTQPKSAVYLGAYAQLLITQREFAEAAFGHLGLTWLSTSQGDDAVFLLTADQLAK